MTSLRSFLASVKKFLGLAANPYQLVLDIWEGNPDLDVPTLLAVGVVGLIVRLNDMNGGHHMDERFEQDWATAKLFPAQTVYFVFNPWVSGRANFDWLMAHLPADFDGRRLMVDTEVKYPGYSPETYATELETFHALVDKVFPDAIYTGAWFLPLVSRWPKDRHYWWASYPDALQGHITWDSLKAAITKMDYDYWVRTSPGPARLWQFSGGGNVLPGFGKHGVDVNLFPGTLDELKQWFGVPDIEPEEPEDMTTPYDNYALGIALDIGQTCDMQAAKAAGFSIVSQVYADDFTVNQKWADIVQDAFNAEMPILG